MNKISRTNPEFAGLVPRVEAFAICMAILIALTVLLVAVISPIQEGPAMPTSVKLPNFSNGRLLLKHFINSPSSSCRSIDIEIDKQKRIHLNGRETTMANLHAQILHELGRKGIAWITLKADQRAPYGWVMEMARFLRNSGWDRFSLVVEGREASQLHHCE